MVRPDKAAAVAEIADRFRNAQGAVLTEFRGLTVAHLQELRRSLAANADYRVAKNTLTKIAVREAGVDAFDGLLEGPCAIAFVRGDPVEVAKGLRDFSRAHPALVVKGAVLDGDTVSPAEIHRMADLESREVLLTKLAGAMVGSLSQAASLFQAPLSQAARVAEARRAQVEAQGGATSAPADPAAAQPVAADPAAADPVAAEAGGENAEPAADSSATES